MAATESDVIRFMREAAPFATDAEAKATLRSTVELISGLLTAEERNILARGVPQNLRTLVWRAESPTPGVSQDFFARIRARSGKGAGRAVEAAEVACGAIGQTLSAEARARLAAALPDLGRFFEPPAAGEPPPVHVGHPPSITHDLAEGHSGGGHPLARANPLELAHRHSVARSDDPHGDTKLSSARGVAQQREGRTLSTGEPGSHRPLSRDH